MFEEICLVCGKHLLDDRRAYCSEDCQNSEVSSPSISSASSVLSSPNMGYAAGGDVPALMPSALGSALRVYARRSGYHLSSSSASSNSCSVFTDEEEDDTAHPFIGRDYHYHDAMDPICDTSSKSANYPYSINSSALSYARRPSGVNNHSTVPHLNSRRMSSGSSGSSALLVRGYPRSAPISSRILPDDEDVLSDLASSGDAADSDDGDLILDNDWGSKPKSPGAAKSRRNRNRASLPACFSILKVSSPTKDFRSSPVSSSSGHTIARPSPPTPKVPFQPIISQLKITPTVTPLAAAYSTPRGRRRETDHSRSSRRSSNSRSRSRSRRIPIGESPRFTERSFHPREPAEEIDVWSMEGPIYPRGRVPIRRNSSPPPRAFTGVEDPNHLLAAIRRTQDADRSHSRSGSRPRGRARVEELGFATSNEAPGFGYGRSGLIDRERAGQSRIPL